MPKLKDEPVALPNAVQALVLAVLGLGQVFGWWALTSEQNGAILAAAVAVMGIITTWQRGKVSPV